MAPDARGVVVGGCPGSQGLPDFAKIDKRTEAERDNLLLLALKIFGPSTDPVRYIYYLI